MAAAAAAALMPHAAAARQAPQSGDLAEAERLSQQVVSLFKEAKYDEALPLARRALRLREQALGRDHLLTAAAAVNLAEQHWAKGEYGEAEPLLKRAAGVFERADGAQAVAGRLLVRLASLASSKRDPSGAEGFYLRALAAKEKAHGPTHEDVIETINAIANHYRANDQAGKAVPLLRRVVAVREAALGTSHPRVGEALQRLACSLRRDGRKEEAATIEARADDILYAAAAAKAEPVALSQEAFNCKLIDIPMPDISSAVRGRTGSLAARVAVVVNEAGRVESARMVEGDEVLRKATEQAAMKARFVPTVVGGRPVKVSGEFNHKFYTRSYVEIVPVPARP